MSKVSSKAIRLVLAGMGLVFPMMGNRVGPGFQPLEHRAAGWSCVRRGGEGPRWVAIPAGTNWLGSRAGRAGEEPRRFATPGFWMTETETTVGEFLAYLQAGGRVASTAVVERVDGSWRARVALDRPMTHVTQDEAAAYAAWLARRLGATVRLPTGDEWEYAARGGVDGAPFPWGWEAPRDQAVLDGQAPLPVRSHAPNRWGLYDMAGNVAEWCAEAGVCRGGSWADRSPAPLRVFHCVFLPAPYADADVGFRVVRQ